MTNPFITLHRSNTILYCRHWIETVRFYKTQMRLPVTFENDWFVEFQLTPHSFLSIANSARATISDVEGQGITLTWEVTDLEEVKAYLERQGVSTTPIQHKWQALVCYCYDPEGHRLEFWSKEARNGAGWNE